MIYIIISLSIICISLFIYIIYLNKKNIKKIQEIKEEFFNKQRKELNEVYLKEKDQKMGELMRIQRQVESSKMQIDSIVKAYEEAQRNLAQKEIDEWTRSAQEAADFNFKQKENHLNSLTKDLENEYIELQTEVEDFRQKRQVINEEIRRRRELEEQQDFYRIQLSSEAKQDIDFLISIVNNFHNKEAIYKIIWSEYLQKPFKLMLNRVLANNDPKNVIYMIQNLNTKEIYIGKTKAEVSKRWSEHIKTSLNIGSISRSLIHKALFNNWDNFSFSILENVPLNTNLNEREKYYIRFYESDKYGYNIKSGG